MTTAQMTGLSQAQAKLADRIAVNVEPVLEGGDSVKSAHATAQFVSLAAVAASVLPSDDLVLISTDETLYIRMVSAFQELAKSISQKVGLATAVGKGAGLGPLVDDAQGRQALHDIAIDMPLEDWAGPLAGSSEIERDLGIRRQTLNNWRNSGDVIAFLKGVSKHVYPLAQFVDGRPVKGLPEIVAAAGGQRAAWLWLTEKNPTLGGKAPIELLRRDKIEVVRKAAEDYFLGL